MGDTFLNLVVDIRQQYVSEKLTKYIIWTKQMQNQRNLDKIKPQNLKTAIDALLHLKPSNWSFVIFTHLKLCLADTIPNFKGVEIIRIWKRFWNIVDGCHVLSLTCS